MLSPVEFRPIFSRWVVSDGFVVSQKPFSRLVIEVLISPEKSTLSAETVISRVVTIAALLFEMQAAGFYNSLLSRLKPGQKTVVLPITNKGDFMYFREVLKKNVHTLGIKICA